MASVSRIHRLPPELRKRVLEMVEDGGFTIDEIARWLRDKLGRDAPSRGSVARYSKRLRDERARAATAAAAELERTNRRLDGILDRLDELLAAESRPKE